MTCIYDVIIAIRLIKQKNVFNFARQHNVIFICERPFLETFAPVSYREQKLEMFGDQVGQVNSSRTTGNISVSMQLFLLRDVIDFS